MRSLVRYPIAALVAFATGVAGAALPTVELSIAGHKLVAEIAAKPDERATGLMHRFSLQPDHGMLFVFERTEPLAFVDEQGRIVNIDDMAPRTEDSHWSIAPARFALEMRKGWFAERGIKAGERVEGIPGVRP
jgi:uncharacterized membrane protein (UPF0127 family)